MHAKFMQQSPHHSITQQGLFDVSNMTVRQAWCVTYQTPVLVDEWWGAAVSPSMYTWMPQPFSLGCAGWGPVASSVMEVSWRGFKPHLAHNKVPYVSPYALSHGAPRCHRALGGSMQQSCLLPHGAVGGSMRSHSYHERPRGPTLSPCAWPYRCACTLSSLLSALLMWV